MRGLLLFIVAIIVPPSCGGCLAPPNVLHPGTESYQQARARVFEPYPEPEPGPPVVGARPREYQEPIAEVNRVIPRPGEVFVAPSPQPLPQAPLAQPNIATPPIYCPPVAAQPVGP